MHLVLLLGLGAIVAIALTSKGKTEPIPVAKIPMSLEAVQARNRIAAFMKQVREGLTVSKTDVDKYHALALKYYSTELASLTSIVLQLKSSGMNKFQLIK